MIVFSFSLPLLLTLLASTVFPLLVGLVSTRETSPGRKAVYLAALNVVAPVLAETADALTNGTTYDLGAALFAALGGFLISVGLHFGLWRPTKVTDKVLDSGRLPEHRA